MVKRYALIDADGRCVNVILLDDQNNPSWTPPNGYTMEQSETRQVDPPPPPSAPVDPPPINGG